MVTKPAERSIWFDTFKAIGVNVVIPGHTVAE